MAQHKYFVSKRQLSHDEKNSELLNLINNEIHQLNKKTSLIKMDLKNKNNNILTNLKMKIQQSQFDLSMQSKLSQNSIKSQKSIPCQIKQNSNSKISQISTKSKPTPQSNLSAIKKTHENNKIKSKLNPQIIQLLLSKQTPTNISNKNEVNSDTVKRTITPNNILMKQKNQKSENLKQPISIKSNSQKILLKFEAQPDLDHINCEDEAIQSINVSQDSFDQIKDQYPFLSSMYQKEKEYQIPYQYINDFQKNQKQITNQIRGILLDWMQQVCMEYMWKRETFHLAQYYLDAFLFNNHNVKRQDLQLVGVTCLQIATKQEEICPPSVKILRQATANIYEITQINQMEINILTSLKYKLNPQTKNVWMNYFILQWDIFMQENIKFLQKTPIYIKQPNNKSYLIFRELFQILDLSILDLKSLLFQPRLLIASILYLVLGKNFNEFNKNQIIKFNIKFDVTAFNFNYFFQNFLIKHFNCDFQNIIIIINYCKKFFEYDFDYEFPRGAKITKDNIIEVLSFQKVSF